MFPGMEAFACPNLAVPAEVMRHVVHVESGANPFAIGVVGARLVRQPRTLEEARATAQMLESRGYNYSLGAAQVNRVNFRKYGLDSYEKAFDPCTNLGAGASILAGCYASAGGDWGKAFSCYYSGNFVTGFRSGYVRKVYDSIRRDVTLAQTSLVPPTVPAPETTAASRISMRVVPLGGAVQPATPPATSPPRVPAGTPVDAAGPFVPQVRRPGASTAPTAPTPTPTLATDRPAGDGAFVF